MIVDKKYFTAYMLEILTPLLPRFQNNPAQPLEIQHVAHYPDGATHAESFARPLWGLAALFSSDEEPELKKTWLKAYKQGFLEGTDPSSEHFWGSIKKNQGSQLCVEMAAMSYAFILCQDSLWASFAKKEQQQIFAWLNQINQGDKNVVDNNWRFFRVLVNSFFKKAELPFSERQIEYDLSQIDSMYLGNSWYQDGHSEQRDYYIPMAMHFYGLLYAYFSPDDSRSGVYKKRAEQFASQFLSWFSTHGEALPFGRSLTYRFAQAAFWSAYMLADLCSDRSISCGEVKGILFRHLEYWKEQRISTANMLQVGYSYPNLFMTESYNAVGSAYWAMKLFAILILPSEHEFWHSEIAPLPVEKAIKQQPEARMIFFRDSSGHVHALCSGQYAKFQPRNANEKYAKYFYSSVFGFNISNYTSNHLESYALDSMLSISLDGINWNHRGETFDHQQTEEGLCSSWRLSSNFALRTLLIPVTATSYLRIHKIQAKAKYYFIEGGTTLPYDSKTQPTILKEITEKNRAFALTEYQEKNFYSSIFALNYQANGHIVYSDCNTNILANRNMIPYLKGENVAGEQILISYASCAAQAEIQAEEITCVQEAEKLYKIIIHGNEIYINLAEWGM